MTGVILASNSRSRADVLRGAGVPFEIVGSDVDEEAIKTRMLAEGRGAKAIAAALAEHKALAVSHGRPGLVIGADQTLELDGRLYDKAATLAEAKTRLQTLRGKTHQLHAAVAAAESGKVVWRDLVTAALHMRDFSDAFLDAYLAAEGDAALGSVGCYRLEGPGSQLFSTIDGDYFAILGLPLLGLLDLLRQRGALAA
jgi:septum formation protein